MLPASVLSTFELDGMWIVKRTCIMANAKQFRSCTEESNKCATKRFVDNMCSEKVMSNTVPNGRSTFIFLNFFPCFAHFFSCSYFKNGTTSDKYTMSRVAWNGINTGVVLNLQIEKPLRTCIIVSYQLSIWIGTYVLVLGPTTAFSEREGRQLLQFINHPSNELFCVSSDESTIVLSNFEAGVLNNNFLSVKNH
jgi:hypothetical protein